MLKDFLWNTFIGTGNISAYLFYKELEERNKETEDTYTMKEEVAISKLAII